ncbi:MAG: ATP-binding protein [Gammaproteobacteria bacterium]|nr:ATP-binding protein [Gammaproteobacteria bacterium]MXX28343.1 ATP-binding protein [Gammaproteobacteria bacterium]MXY06383.1 ATP-binding protein [Gammaproteobacteria bacterium]MYE52396.1 ATP-binding protein [Gammaproteobacteria bacterium]MYE85189.1 ATP-binding protein [Gammaproteobacteria bacterium]
MTADMLANVSTAKLSRQESKRILKLARAGLWTRVFPAGSMERPRLLVGRERQAAKLNALMDELLGRVEGRGGGTLGVVLYGPRGVGKTVLLDTLAEFAEGSALVVRGTGNSLASVSSLIQFVLGKISPAPETTRSSRGKLALGGTGIEGGVETKTLGGRPQAGSVEDAMIALVGDSGGGMPKPTLMTFDEAHVSDPLALGALLNAVQLLNGKGWPVAVTLAGTPDVLDVLRGAKATWFLDRGASRRLIPVGNLTDRECALAISEPLHCAGVQFDLDELDEAAKWCRGSPYFSQALGLSALVSAYEEGGGERRADFREGGPVGTRFQEAALNRYVQAWADIDDKGLTGCARQLGALWRWSQADPNREIDSYQVDQAVQSGLRTPPINVEAQHSPREAKRHFRHLGLLWSPSGSRSGPWEVGVPSFFDYVESIYQSETAFGYHRTLEALNADLAGFIPRESSSGEERGRPASS